MDNEIYDIIKKNLPAQVGETLRGVIEQGQKDAETVTNLKKQLCGVLNEIDDLRIKLQNYQKLDSRNSELDKREIDIKNREQKLTEDELHFQLKEVEKRTGDMLTLVSLLVKNPRAIELLSSTSYGQQNELDQYGGMHQARNTNNTIIGTKEVSFTKE